MSRGALALDRVVAAVLGLALLAGAAWLVAWTAGVLPAALADPEEVQAGGSGLASLPDQAWWPWAVGLGGAVVAALGLLWLLAHLTSRSVGRIELPDSGHGGVLDLDASAAATAAADVLAANRLDVRSSKGRVREEGRSVVLDLDVVLDPDADLHEVARSCDAVAVQARRTLGRDDLHCRVRLRVASPSSGGRRLR